MKWLAIGTGALAALVVALFDNRLCDNIVLPKESVYWAGAAALAAAWALLRWRGGGGFLRIPSGLAASWLGLAGASAAVTFFSWSQWESWPGFFAVLTGMALATALADSLSPGCVLILYRWLAAAAAAAGLYAVAQHFRLDPLTWIPSMAPVQVISSFGNPLHVAGFMAMMLPVALSLMMVRFQGSDAHWPSWLPIGALWILVITTLVFAYSWGGYVAAAAGVGVFLWALGADGRRRGRRVLAWVAVLTILIGGWAAWDELRVITETRGGMIQAGNDSKRIDRITRLYLWKVAWRIVADHPVVGTGPGTFALAYPRYRWDEPAFLRARNALPEAPHNTFLEVAAGQGMVGLAALCWVLGAVAATGWAGLRRVAAGDRPLAAAALGAGTAFWVHNAFVYDTPPTTLCWWIMAGVLGASASWGDFASEGLADGAPRGRAGRGWWLAAAAALCLGAAFFTCMGAARIRSSAACWRADDEHFQARAARDPSAAVAHWRVALEQGGAMVADWPWSARQWTQWGFLLQDLYQSERGLAPMNRRRFLYHAEQAFEQAVALNPLDASSWNALANAWGLMAVEQRNTAPGAGNAYRQALAHYQHAMALDPYNPRILDDLAFTHEQVGRFPAAEDALHRSVELDPFSALTHVRLGEVYVREGRWEAAQREAEEARRLDPSAPGLSDLVTKLKQGPVKPPPGGNSPPPGNNL